MMTKEELTRRCEGRNFDRIVVVVRSLEEEIKNLRHVQKIEPAAERTCTQETAPGLELADGEKIAYSQRSASYYFENTELYVVEPLEGNTVYKQFLDRYGQGLCCTRERVPAADFERLEREYLEKKIPIIQRVKSDKYKAFWLDLTESLGIYHEVFSDDSFIETPAAVIPQRIAQINISTPDVKKTIMKLAETLEIGPWEVGRQNNSIVKNPAFRVNGELKDVEFSFLVAILVCGNIEWEVIEPEKGPLVYSDFIARRGIGFHHILTEIPQGEWDRRLAQYEADGIQLSCRGTLGPIDWCYEDTEKELQFFIELRTDAVMDRLPDGYLQYFYPDE